MMKAMLLAGLVAVGLCHARPASAEQYFGWTRLVNTAWNEETGHPGGDCIDVPRGSTQAGTVVAMYPCHHGTNQRFRLKDNNFDSTRIAVYTGADERCLGYSDLQRPPAKVVIASCDTAPRWRTAATGEIAIADFKSCMIIAADGRLELRPNCNSFPLPAKAAFGSSWYIRTLDLPYGNAAAMVSLRKFDCIDVRGGSRTPGASLLHYACHGGANQMFQLRGLLSQVFITVYSDGEMLCLSNVGVALGGGNPAATQAVPCNRTDLRQVWGVTAAGAQGRRFLNWHSRRCLDAFANTWDVGAWNCNGASNQRWGLLNFR